MPGLQRSQLHPASMYAGDTVEYYSRVFVAGDARGHRTAVVLKIAEDVDTEYPISVDTGEAIPRDMMLKLAVDRAGIGSSLPLRREPAPSIRPSSALFKMHSPLQPKSFVVHVRDFRRRLAKNEDGTGANAVTSNSHLSPPSTAADDGSVVIIDSSLDNAEGGNDREGLAVLQVEVSKTPEPDVNLLENGLPSRTPITSAEPHPGSDHAFVTNEEDFQSEGTTSYSVETPVEPPTDKEVLDAEEYILSIPTRLERAKIRHQPRKRAVGWHTPHSRKRRYQVKCAVTRSGTQIHHVRSVKAHKVKELLKHPGVKRRLVELHERRPVYKTHTESRVQLAELPWPAGIRMIVECEANGITFPDLGSFDKCQCKGDCFWDSCANAGAAVYCTPSCCNLGARCSNASINRTTVKLFETGRVGVGVYTTTDLDVGDIVGEYVGKLSEWSALVPGQPDQAMKANSGYTLLYNVKSVKKKYVYVDALTCGSITRFISHACDPNAVFVEMQNRRNAKVIVKMIKNVKAGAEITVNYGNERCFVCACEDCWQGDSATAAT
ncbi:hypothetical protein F442_02772 [Phytophthora nicotianae P10297]|uniref:SET domain-containing protein n=1 Tax=Phytophthora nicotianae P10297 TaxID=1317064 RepID=W3A0W7_PHYNI|nr:hypothetical protein F442_02772 [Phytophthora nicotianae P10297]